MNWFHFVKLSREIGLLVAETHLLSGSKNLNGVGRSLVTPILKLLATFFGDSPFSNQTPVDLWIGKPFNDLSILSVFVNLPGPLGFPSKFSGSIERTRTADAGQVVKFNIQY